MRTLFVCLILIAALLVPVVTQATMSSPSYTIYADDVGINGGGDSTSTSYDVQNTTGGSPVGFTTSSSYELRGGYQAMERDDLSLDISNTSLNLGSLSTNQVNSVSTVVTITSYSLTGYTLAISNVSGTMIASVTDGEVTPGSEEYGLAVSGTGSSVTGDVAVVNGLSLASSASPVYSTPLTLTFKASAANTTPAGSYSQSITLTASANF